MFTQERVNPVHFERDVLTHLISNKLKRVNPRYKAVTNHIIVGSSGSGKSTGLQDICDKYGVPLFVVQGSSLVSQMEGQGTAPIEDAILEASQTEGAWITACSTDDWDMGGGGRIGAVDNKATQGFFMSWFDHPDQLTIERPNQRARTVMLQNPPVSFMTTNNLDAIHPPIVAPHRSTITVLDPQGAEKDMIIVSMFSSLGDDDAIKLAQHFADQPIAFFATLRTEASKDAIMSGAEHLKYKFSHVDWEGFNRFVASHAEGATLKDLIEAGEKIAAQDRSANFIAPPKPTPKFEVVHRSPRKPLSKTNGAAGRGNGRAKTPPQNKQSA
ncbi:MAG: AAA family ATPase [Pseudomonadota bacterium]